MKIIFNGKDIDIDNEITLLQCLLAQNLDPNKVVVELNTIIVPSAEFAETRLHDNDSLEVLHFVGGG